MIGKHSNGTRLRDERRYGRSLYHCSIFYHLERLASMISEQVVTETIMSPSRYMDSQTRAEDGGKLAAFLRTNVILFPFVFTALQRAFLASIHVP